MKRKLVLALLALALIPALSWAQGQNFPGSGSNSGAAVPAPIMAFYIGPQCQVANTGQCFFTPADTQEFNDISWTNTTGVLTANTSEFAAAMVGMSVMGFRTCSGDVTNTLATGGAIAPNVAPPTVSAFTSATSITINATPANAQTLQAAQPIGGCLIIGHLDDAGFAALSTAIAAATQCPKVFFSAANYFLTTPPGFMTTNPSACVKMGAQLGGVAGNVGFGTVTLPAGMEIEGRGTGNTALFLATNFPNGDPCNHLPTPSASGPGACFIVPPLGAWRDFRIDGGGQGAPTGLFNKVLIYMAVAKMRDFLCMNYGGYIGGSTGIELSWENQLDFVNNSGCGAVGVSVDSGVSLNVGNRLIVESSSFNALRLLGPTPARFPDNNLQCYACTFLQANVLLFSPAAVVENLGGSLVMFGGFIGTYNGNNGANTNNGLYAYSANTTSGGKLYADDVTFTDGTGGANNTNGGIICSVACTNTLIHSLLKSQSAAFDIQDATGSSEIDLGGNTYTPRFSIAGTFRHNETGTCTFAAATTCAVTFNRTFGTQGTPSFFVPPNIVGTTTTLTVSALSATGATITASASNSGAVQWQAVQQ